MREISNSSLTKVSVMAASGQKNNKNNQVNKASPYSPKSQDYLNRIEEAEKANDTLSSSPTSINSGGSNITDSRSHALSAAAFFLACDASDSLFTIFIGIGVLDDDLFLFLLHLDLDLVFAFLFCFFFFVFRVESLSDFEVEFVDILPDHAYTLTKHAYTF